MLTIISANNCHILTAISTGPISREEAVPELCCEGEAVHSIYQHNSARRCFWESVIKKIYCCCVPSMYNRYTVNTNSMESCKLIR